MLSFESDYTRGAHARVLQRLLETNLEPQSGYGNDDYCKTAAEKIRAACGCPQADVFFLVGGTQANAVVIDALLKRYEGVLCAETGHIAVHEAGAVEYTGHKVLPLPHRFGKLDVGTVRAALSGFHGDANRAHMVQPGIVYLSHPTELGTLYTAAELRALSAVCREHRIPLYLDGARLAYGLAAEGADVTLPLIAECCDAFYIGGTKCGALCGEAVVFPHGAPRHFFTTVKQHGALLAKGRLLGAQFDALFTDGLYLDLGRRALEMAALLRSGLAARGFRFAWESPTNQQFVVFADTLLKRLSGQVALGFWERADGSHTIVRLATSWATRHEEIDALFALLDGETTGGGARNGRIDGGMRR